MNLGLLVDKSATPKEASLEVLVWLKNMNLTPSKLTACYMWNSIETSDYLQDSLHPVPRDIVSFMELSTFPDHVLFITGDSGKRSRTVTELYDDCMHNKKTFTLLLVQ